MTAHDAASTPENIAKLFRIPGSGERWECMGYSRTGYSVRFARLTFRPRLSQVNRYIDPDTVVEEIQE